MGSSPTASSMAPCPGPAGRVTSSSAWASVYTPERLDSACRRALWHRRGMSAAPGPGRGGAAPTPASGPIRPPRRGIRPRESSQPSVNRIHRINRRRSVMPESPNSRHCSSGSSWDPTLPERIMDYAAIILSDEVNRRADRRLELRLRAAGFPAGWKTSTGPPPSPWTAGSWTLSSPWSSSPGMNMSCWWVPPASADLPGPGPGLCRGQGLHRPLLPRRRLLQEHDPGPGGQLRRPHLPLLPLTGPALDDLGLHRLTAQQSTSTS